MPSDVKPWLHTLVVTCRTETLRLVRQLPADQRRKTGALQDWAPKDEIAHLAYWIALFATNLKARRAGKPLIDTRPYLALNDAAWAQRKAWSWVQVKAALDESLSAVDHQLATLNLTALTDGQVFNLEPHRKAPRPVVKSALYELIDHPLHHLTGLYRKIGARPEALAMLERVQAAVKAPGTSKWSGTTTAKIKVLISAHSNTTHGSHG